MLTFCHFTLIAIVNVVNIVIYSKDNINVTASSEFSWNSG